MTAATTSRLTPYEQGAYAYRRGMSAAANPYPVEPDRLGLERMSWHNGWRRAEYEGYAEYDPPYT